jgi:YYY domain-containing protein
VRDMLFWIAVVELVGLAALPLLRAYFGNRRDAALLARPVGLAIVAYTGWAFTRLASGHFSRGTLIAAFVAVAFGGALVNRSRKAAVGSEPLFGTEEKLAAAIFWGTAGAFLLLRAAVPEILGAEKFMDLAFLNSLTRRESMPPADPWLAGFTINYYYWGYLLAAVPAKLAGINPSVAYNLALATFAGFSSCAAACLGFRLSSGRLAAGLGAAALTVFAGNAAGALDALHNPLARDFDYWPASRVIGLDPATHEYTTINEFPFFTFFHADLHPHLLAFPFFLAAFALAHRFMERGKHLASAEALTFKRLTGPAASGLLLALVAGTSVAANKWTLPAIGILLVFAGIFRTTQGRRLPEYDEGVLGAVAGVAVFLVGLALFFWYEQSYQLPNKGTARTTLTSGLLEFLAMWGTLFALSYLALRPRAPEKAKARERFQLFVAAVIAGSFLLGLLLKPATPVLTVVLPLAILAGSYGWKALHRADADGSELFTAFLLLFALAMITGCEFVHFKDNYGEKLQRMNTLFKFYHQAWPLLAVAGAVLVEKGWREGGRSRHLFRVVLGVAVAASALYPLECFVSRLRQHSGPFSLDARTALERRAPGDAAAIGWLEQNAQPNDVVLEATGNPYSEFARISSHTGIPTVLGWGNHEGLWRGDSPEISVRQQAVKSFYTQPEAPLSEQILDRFHVTLVVVGELERQTYPGAAAVAEAPGLISVLQGPTSVYRVVRLP